MYLNYNLIPVHQWTHREFAGADPWAGNQRVQWSVVVYRMFAESLVNSVPVARQVVPPGSNNVPAKFAIGIFARAHNRYRVLPLALQDLWRAGKVRDEDLPWLLHRIEAPLRISDYPPGRMSRGLFLYGILCAVASLAGWACLLSGLDFDVGLWTGLICAAISMVCFGVVLVWRERRRRFAEKWLEMLCQERTSLSRQAANSRLL